MDSLWSQPSNRLIKMAEEPVVDAKDAMDSDILCLREGSRKFEKGLCKPEKILDLSPLFLVELQIQAVPM